MVAGLCVLPSIRVGTSLCLAFAAPSGGHCFAFYALFIVRRLQLALTDMKNRAQTLVYRKVMLAGLRIKLDTIKKPDSVGLFFYLQLPLKGA